MTDETRAGSPRRVPWSRLVIGSLAFLVVSAAVLLDETLETALATTALAVTVGCWASVEYSALVLHPPDRFLRLAGGVGAACFLILPWLEAKVGLDGGTAIASAISGTILLFFIGAVARKGFDRTHLANVGLGILGVFYVGFLLGAILRIRYLPDGLYLTGVLILAVKGNDIAAYTFGRWVGRRPLARVSPKKTVEGSVAGILAGAAIMVAAAAIRPEALFPWQRAWIPGIILGVVSQLGDLAESVIKRSVGVKDSGHSLAGFGGILDMIDSLLFAGPAFYLMLPGVIPLD